MCIRDSDYTAPSGTVSITIGLNGTGEALVNIPAIDDAAAEGAEQIRLALSASDAYLLDDDRSAVVRIFDNDSGGTGNERVGISIFPDTTSESAPGLARFYISRTGTTGDLVVPYTISGTATGGADYTGLTSGSVTIAAGKPGALLSFTVLQDTLGEGSENVTVTLGTNNGYSLDVDRAATYWITDNDVAPITVGFEVTQLAMAEEGDPLGNTRDIVVKLSGASGSPVSVSYGGGGGTAVGDNIDWVFLDPATHLPVNDRVLTFAPGETSKVIRVRVNPDRIVDDGEFALLQLALSLIHI